MVRETTIESPTVLLPPRTTRLHSDRSGTAVVGCPCPEELFIRDNRSRGAAERVATESIAFQATFFRTALLLGLLRGEAVHSWAERLIADETVPPRELIEIATASVKDLSALRHALWPLVIDPEPAAVVHAILGHVHEDLASGRRTTANTLTVLRQMRSILRLPPDIYSGLNAALVAYSAAPDRGVLENWLSTFTPRQAEADDE